jgi:predicted ATPase
MNSIKRFEIKKLHGRKNFDLRIKDNTLILVGENGTGKSTVLQLFYYIMSGQWWSLLKYDFDSLKLTIDDIVYSINQSDLKLFRHRHSSKALKGLPASIRNELIMHGDYLSPYELERISDEYGIPPQFLLREIDHEFFIQDKKPDVQSRKIGKIHEDIKNSINSQILYLPTYRRIEQELESIFKGFDDRELRKRERFVRRRTSFDTFVELVEFGMKDVDNAIVNKVSELEKFAREELNKLTVSYLGNIVEHEYMSIDLSKIKEAKDEDIENVISRIQEPILTRENKNRLRTIIGDVRNKGKSEEHDRIVCHYFTKLMAFHQELEEKESNIVNFCDVCNEYMENKTFRYNSSSYSFSITENYRNKGAQDIKLHQLSSGEKQIVSLFSHLYLSGGSRNYFVLIDEPELSLSVPWQRRFLKDIRSSDFCSGLVAVTHSPFIYENQLQQYAHGLGEFIS